jgi:predicted nucleic acid-binding protein
MNMLDSCGWLEHLCGGGNHAFFAPVLRDTPQLLVASLSIYEVCRRVLALHGPEQATVIYRAMTSVPVVQLDAAGMYQAALASKQHQLHMADAIIWQTAQQHGARLYTQDAALQSLPGVAYQAKPPATV